MKTELFLEMSCGDTTRVTLLSTQHEIRQDWERAVFLGLSRELTSPAGVEGS